MTYILCDFLNNQSSHVAEYLNQSRRKSGAKSPVIILTGSKSNLFSLNFQFKLFLRPAFLTRNFSFFIRDLVLFFSRLWFGKLSADELQLIKIDSFPIGIFIYDLTLSLSRLSTLKYKRLFLIPGIYRSSLKCYLSFYLIKIILRACPPNIVMLSHRSTPIGGALLFFSKEYNIKCFSWGFNNQSKRFCIRPGSELFRYYEYSPTLLEKKFFKSHLSDTQINELFLDICELLYSGKLYKDAKMAYGNVSPFSNSLSKSSMPSKIPTIGIFFHAFTDFPNTHFGKQNFLDYRDWIDQIVAFILETHHKYKFNWILREHPNNKQYPVRDFDFRHLSSLLSDYPNVSLQYGDTMTPLAETMEKVDLVSSCGGSILAESVAIFNKPCLAAFQFHQYNAYDFCLTANSSSNYFKLLVSPSSFVKPSALQINEAKLAILYTYLLSSWPFALNNKSMPEYNNVTLEEIFPHIYTDFDSYLKYKLNS